MGRGYDQVAPLKTGDTAPALLADNSTYVIDENEAVANVITLYVVWAENTNGNTEPDVDETPLTLTYDGNDGTGTIADVTGLLAGNKVTTAREGFTKTNAILVGWSEAKTADIAAGETEPTGIIALGGEYTVNQPATGDTVTLYAVWAEDKLGGGAGTDPDPDKKPDYKQTFYKLSYAANGGTGTIADVLNLAEGAKVTTAAAGFTLDGHVLDGWSTAVEAAILEDGSNVPANMIALGGEYTMPAGDAMLNAVWAVDADKDGTPDYKQTTPQEKVTITIHMLENGTATPLKTAIKLPMVKSDTSTPIYAPEVAGYTATKASETVVPNGDKEITFYYIQNQTTVIGGGGGGTTTVTYYTLSFQENGGNAIEPVTRVSGTTVNLRDYTPVRTGYTFAGWYTDAGLTTSVTSVVLTNNIVVYAKWEGGPVFVTDHFAYIIGRDDGMVAPTANITRAEVAISLCLIGTPVYNNLAIWLISEILAILSRCQRGTQFRL